MAKIKSTHPPTGGFVVRRPADTGNRKERK